MKFKIVDVATVPTPTKAPNPRRQQATELVLSLTAGKVAAVTPEKTETLRGVKSLITRTGKREGRQLRVWDHEGSVYVGLRDG